MTDDLITEPINATEPEPASVHNVDVPCQAMIVLKRDGAETEYVFPVNYSAIIGRYDPSVGPVDIDLKDLPEGAFVSRHHASVTWSDTGWTLKDLGSSNHTWILEPDGSQFDEVQEAPLQDGTDFALGNARFVFHLRGDSVSEPPAVMVGTDPETPPEPESVQSS